MIKNANRINIIGGSGSGKTTLANNLGDVLNLPVYHIDGMHHLDNWERRNQQERDKILYEKVAQDKWIIDGTYRKTLPKRIEKADFNIYLDYSSLAQLKGVIRKIYKRKRKRKTRSTWM